MNEKKKLKVLHLASFSGNIGDIANHAGTRYLFQKYLDFDFVFSELEIREFYWKQRIFDDDFVSWANSFDLLLIGGGNYFELWVENSETGTSIDISLSRLSNIKVPTIFYSLGVDIGQGYTDKTAERFNRFMKAVLERENMFVCVRNDGSSKALNIVLSSQIAEKIPVMPDGGFFAAESLEKNFLMIEKENKKISINIAGDMLERRFNGHLTSKDFLQELSNACILLLESYSDLNIELVPHIWRDVTFIAELLSKIPDQYMRRRIKIASLNPTKAGLFDFLKGYAMSDLVLGMRFHANVCPISMNVPTKGLLNYPQVELLYEELLRPDRFQDVRSSGFGLKLAEKSLDDMKNLHLLRHQNQLLNKRLFEKANDVLKDLNEWLHKCVC